MKKIEFLAASLPYDLQVYNEKGVQKTYAAVHYSHEFEPEFEKFTPILRPLSDLTKEIEHKGERFVPIERLNELLPYGTKSFGFAFEFDSRGVFGLLTPNSWLPFINYFPAMLKLIEWHFDIADLISKGEAIDVNTLNINPYK